MRTLVLVGSGEFTQSMVKTDRYLIGQVRKTKIKVAVIPTASVPDGRQKKWIEDGIKHFKKLGTNPIGINIVSRKDANKRTSLDKLKTASIIYFSGGHPGYLFKTFQDTYSWELIESLYKNGRILVGSSAGAMILGDYLLTNAQESFDKGIEPKWIKGFNLVPYTIFPHFDWVQKNKLELFRKILDSAPKAVRERWIGIDEDTSFVVFDGKNVKLLGKETVYICKKGKMSKYVTGKEFII